MKPPPSKQQKDPIISDSRSTQINFLWDKYKGPFILRPLTPYSTPYRGAGAETTPQFESASSLGGRGGGVRKRTFFFSFDTLGLANGGGVFTKVRLPARVLSANARAIRWSRARIGSPQTLTSYCQLLLFG